MGNYSAQFGTDLCLKLGVQPTIDNLIFLQAWSVAEGGTAAWNPFNTTQRVAGSTNYNSFGPNGEYHVQNYPTYTAGLNATTLTLNNGHYAGILAALAAGGDAMVAAEAVAASPWGTGGGVAAQLTRQGYHYNPPAPPAKPTIYEAFEEEEPMQIIDVPGIVGAWVLFPNTGVYLHIPSNDDVQVLIRQGATPPAGFITEALHEGLLLGRPPYSIPAA